jgi:hypothetical protein
MNTKSDNDSLNPAIPDSIVALATRIKRAMRLSMGGPEARLYPEDSGREATSDAMTILGTACEVEFGGDRLRRAFVNARITWLAGVLAGAMGERNTRENHDGK